MHRTVLLTICAAVFSLSTAYKFYQEKIPNGGSVPHPCKPNYLWKGVGHLAAGGAGRRNPFGEAFAALGHKWTKDLCKADSDGDGRTNGEELGDPSCIWQPGKIPTNVKGITHPGVCEPFDSPLCKDKNSWVKCEKESLDCPALNTSGVQTMDLRMPNTSIPLNETFYMCTVIDLPTDDDYHLIGLTPLIDNEYVIHHTTMMGCDSATGGSKFDSKPGECGMTGFGEGCGELVGVWTLGSPGHCFHKDVGILFGKNGLKRIIVQNHYTNPEGRPNWYDNSGIRIYYTKNLRKYEGGTWIIGQQRIEIPAGTRKQDVIGHCPSNCTSDMAQPMHIVDGLMHAHYLGTGITVQHARHGKNYEYIINEVPYSYDNPIFHTMKKPIEIRPGDELTVKCSYQSMNRKTHTSWGLGTYDEMCYAIFFYYPKLKETPDCVPFGNISRCSATPVYKGCNNHKFIGDQNNDGMYKDILNRCGSRTCDKQCALALRKARSEKCLQGESLEYQRFMTSFRRTFKSDFHDLFRSMAKCTTNDKPKTVLQKVKFPKIKLPVVG